MPLSILQQIEYRHKSGLKSLTLLIDPDKFDEATCQLYLQLNAFESANFIFVGGSLMVGANMGKTIALLKKHTTKPIIIFPGSSMHIDFQADAILFLSLISGRNADLLIGQHVIAAPILKKSNLEILPTGYMLVEGGKQTTVSYISNTTPLPADKPEVAACTAMAGEMLGLKLIYADAGSGAEKAISPKMVSMLRKSVSLPIIIGGGIKTVEKAVELWRAGADMLVIGNAVEEDPTFFRVLAQKLAEINHQEIA